VDFDAKGNKNSNVIEQAVTTIKNWRGLATRYDKYAITFRGSVVLAAIVMWLP